MSIAVFAIAPELEDAIARLNGAPAELADAVSRYAGDSMLDAWTDELAKSRASRVQSRVLIDSARAFVMTRGFQTRSGASNTPLSGGLIPSEAARAFEFGTNKAYKHPGFMQRSRKGLSYWVRGKNTNAPLPSRSRTGWVAYPAADRIAKRAASLFAQTVYRTVADRIDGGAGRGGS